MKKLLLLSAMAALFTLSGAEFRVRGKVTAPDVKSVAVCDGEKFYPVNKDGSFDFTFCYEGTGFVYLDHPSSLKPEGRWATALKPGENNVNFKLTAQNDVPETFTFVHGSDVQYNFKVKRGELMNDMYEISQVMKNANARFIVFPGDMTEFGEVDQLAILKQEIDNGKFRYFPYFGGHDRLKSKPSYKNFTECFGAPYFGWHFGGIYFFSPVSEYQSLPERYARDRQVRWMKNALSRLAPGTPVLVNTHQPWYIFDLVESFAKAGKIKLLGFLGGHTHYHNLYEYKGYPVLCVAPLRSHDSGSFTKRLRLVTINPQGIVSTETRLLNQVRRVEPTLYNGNQLLVRVADYSDEPRKVSVAVNNKTIELKKLNQLVWGGVLPEKITDPKGVTAVVSVELARIKFNKTVKLVNVPELKWCAVLPDFQRSYPQAAVQGNMVFAGIEHGELPVGKNGGVVAFDRKSGKQLWRFNCPDVAVAVAADAKTVRAFDINGVLYTLDIRNGKLLRSVTIPRRTSMYTRTHAGVKLAEGKVFVSLTHDSRAYIYCLDAQTDKFAWKKPLSLNSAWNAVNFTIKDGKLYYNGASCNGCVNIADGSHVWLRRDASKTSQGNHFFEGENVYFYLRATLLKLNAKTGKPVWRDPKVPGSSTTIGGVCVKDGKVLAVSTNGLVVDDAKTGKRIYRYNLQPLEESRGIGFQFLANTAAPMIWKNKILLLGDNGAVYDAADYLRTAGIPKGVIPPKKIFETGFAFKGTPVIDGDMAFFIGFDGVVYALEY
ncbi:MAG: PQQ-binding-like beta-propeller repeat protein [Lentisphaeria bacterium]|nr:PQQ-binding-like beta-propeller repeat protein [Lentisphaeria bacterium]